MIEGLKNINRKLVKDPSERQDLTHPRACPEPEVRLADPECRAGLETREPRERKARLEGPGPMPNIVPVPNARRAAAVAHGRPGAEARDTAQRHKRRKEGRKIRQNAITKCLIFAIDQILDKLRAQNSIG